MRGWSRVVAIAMVLAVVACAPGEPPPDPTSHWETLSEAPLSPRHEAVGLWTGQEFLVVGGDSGPPCPPNASCRGPVDPPRRDGATYDPVSKTWQKIPDAPVPVSAFGNATVVHGVVYLITWDVGRADAPRAMLRFDPRMRAWARLPLPPSDDARLTSAGDRVVAVSQTDEYEPAVDSWFDDRAQRWRELPADPLRPSFGREAVWTNAGLLLGAAELASNPGSEKPAVIRLARLDPTFRHWTKVGTTEIIGGGPVAVDHRVVWPMTGSADGGEVNGWGRPYPFGGVLDPETMAWTPLPEPTTPNSDLAGYPVRVGSSVLVDGQLLRPSSSTWTSVPPGPWQATQSMTVVGSEQSLLVWGGSTDTSNTNQGYLLSFE